MTTTGDGAGNTIVEVQCGGDPVTFPDCFPFCDEEEDFRRPARNRNRKAGGGRKPLVSFPPCFPFCDNSNFSKFVNRRRGIN